MATRPPIKLNEEQRQVRNKMSLQDRTNLLGVIVIFLAIATVAFMLFYLQYKGYKLF